MLLSNFFCPYFDSQRFTFEKQYHYTNIAPVNILNLPFEYGEHLLWIPTISFI